MVPEPLDDPELPADPDDDEPDDDEDEPDDEESEPELDSDDEEPESFVLAVGLAAGVFLPRLSVLKNPDPLNVTPTGVKTFFTGRTLPLAGWAISVRFSSWKPCWTSMVSPVSTNL